MSLLTIDNGVFEVGNWEEVKSSDQMIRLLVLFFVFILFYYVGICWHLRKFVFS